MTEEKSMRHSRKVPAEYSPGKPVAYSHETADVYFEELRKWYESISAIAKFDQAIHEDLKQGKPAREFIEPPTFQDYSEGQAPPTHLMEHRLNVGVKAAASVLDSVHTRHTGNRRFPHLERLDSQSETVRYRLTEEEGIFSPSLIEFTPIEGDGCELRIYPNESHLSAFRIGVDAYGSSAHIAGDTSPRCTLICIDFLKRLHELHYIVDDATDEAQAKPKVAEDDTGTNPAGTPDRSLKEVIKFSGTLDDLRDMIAAYTHPDWVYRIIGYPDPSRVKSMVWAFRKHGGKREGNLNAYQFPRHDGVLDIEVSVGDETIEGWKLLRAHLTPRLVINPLGRTTMIDDAMMKDATQQGVQQPTPISKANVSRDSIAMANDTAHQTSPQPNARQFVAVALFVLGVLIAVVANVVSSTLPKELGPYLWLSWPVLGILVLVSVVLLPKQ